LLIELDLSVAGATRDLEIRAIELLALAHREGKHLLLVSPMLCQKLSSNTKIEPHVLRLLNTASATFAEHAALRGSLPYYVRVTLIGTGPRLSASQDANGATVQVAIITELSHFADSAKIQPSVLLAEDSTDAELLSRLADGYRYRMKCVPRVHLQCEHGGGARTGLQVTRLAATGLPHGVVVDSDKSGPSSAAGGTLKAVMDAAKANPCSLRLFVHPLDARELENQLPNSVYQLSDSPEVRSAADCLNALG
jgi:hypothetical protein